jgi:CDP-glucose 4,6-dehydratase
VAFWIDRPVLVTGASGFIGGWLVDRLVAHGAAVVCLVRDAVPRSPVLRPPLSERVTVVRGDVRDQALLERALGEYEIATAFHLAAQTLVPIANQNPVSTLDTNVAGTWALLEACRRSPRVAQIVIASSDKAYGAHDVLPYDEATPLRARHPYDVSKACADLIAQSFAQTFGLPIAITRFGNCYGGGDWNPSRLVPGTIRAALRGERPSLRSDGRFVRDWLYVEDAAEAYLLLAEALAARPALAGEAFNFSLEAPLSVLDLVRRILAVMGSDLEPIVRGEATHEIPAQSLSAARAREVLGWSPRFSLDEGLARTVAWYRAALAR